MKSQTKGGLRPWYSDPGTTARALDLVLSGWGVGVRKPGLATSFVCHRAILAQSVAEPAGASRSTQGVSLPVYQRAVREKRSLWSPPQFFVLDQVPLGNCPTPLQRTAITGCVLRVSSSLSRLVGFGLVCLPPPPPHIFCNPHLPPSLV